VVVIWLVQQFNNLRGCARARDSNEKLKMMVRGDDTYPVICELHSWNYEDATVACLPVIVTNEGTLASRAFALSDACHSEANAFRLVKWGRI